MSIIENYFISLLDVDNLEDCLEVFQIFIINYNISKNCCHKYELCVSHLLDCIKNE